MLSLATLPHSSRFHYNFWRKSNEFHRLYRWPGCHHRCDSRLPGPSLNRQRVTVGFRGDEPCCAGSSAFGIESRCCRRWRRIRWRRRPPALRNLRARHAKMPSRVLSALADGPTQERATDKLATALLPKGDKPAVPQATSQRPWRRRLTTWTTLALRRGVAPSRFDRCVPHAAAQLRHPSDHRGNAGSFKL